MAEWYGAEPVDRESTRARATPAAGAAAATQDPAGQLPPSVLRGAHDRRLPRTHPLLWTPDRDRSCLYSEGTRSTRGVVHCAAIRHSSRQTGWEATGWLLFR